jgi:hypothetical protein
MRRSHQRIEQGAYVPDYSEHFGEPPLARRRRMKQKAKEKRVLEVDRSGSARALERAAKRLKSAAAKDRVLHVPQWDMDKAIAAMKQAGVSGSVRNLCNTRQTRVKARRR